MILTDTASLVALFNCADDAHGRCADTLKDIDEPVATTLPVLTEAFHLLGMQMGSDHPDYCFCADSFRKSFNRTTPQSNPE